MINKKNFLKLNFFLFFILIVYLPPPSQAQPDVTFDIGEGSGLPCLLRGSACNRCDQTDCYQLGQGGVLCAPGDENCYLNEEIICTGCNEGICFEMGTPCVQQAVPISMENLNNRIKGLEMRMRDAGNYLRLTGCETTDRTNGFSCLISDIQDDPLDPSLNGSFKVILVRLQQPIKYIEQGTGPICYLTFQVQNTAPRGECRAINAEEVKATDEFFHILEVETAPGEFCFLSPPSCSGVSPNAGMQGNSYTVTITGENTNFVQGTTQVSFENSGITVDSVTVQSSTVVNASITIASTAPTGLGDVTVTTGSEIVVCYDDFTVQQTVLGCVSVAPSFGYQGDTDKLLTITGQNTHFVQGTTQVSFSGTGITVISGTTQVSSSTEVSVRINIAETAAIGMRTVTVTTGSEIIQCTNAFQVLEKQIACLEVSPPNGMQDSQNLRVVITGQYTHFVQGTTQVSFENPGITITSTTVDSATQITVLIDIVGDALAGTGDVTVATGTEVIVCRDSFTVLEKIFEISEIRESNPTSASFTVSWITNGNANGLVHYSLNPDLTDFMTAYDDRGVSHLDDTHHVSIGDLNPETTYYYEIVSGGTIDNNSGLYYSFSTMKIPSEPPPTCPAYGWVYLEDGVTPAEGAIVYLEISHYGESSYWISGLVNSIGIWVLNLGDLYSTITDDLLPYSEGDPLLLEFQGGSGRVYTTQLEVPAVCPLYCGTVTLEHLVTLAMSLRTGYNLIAFPFEAITDSDFNEITYTACDLIASVPECDQTFAWDANGQRWLTALDIGGGVCIGDDFLIQAGSGYFAKCNVNTTGTFYGKELAYPLPLTFEPGFNLIAVSYPPNYYSSCSLIGSIAGSTKAFSWSPSFQRWLSSLVIEGGLCIGDGFTIEPAKGYFTHNATHIDRWVPGVGGVCSSVADCDDNNVCTDEACVDDICIYANNTSSCEDGLYCTVSDTCSGGVCSAGGARDCSASADQCNIAACDEGLNQCVAQPRPNGTACEDGLFCTEADQCTGGVCVAGPARDCSASGDQCNDGVCSETTDQCVAQPKANGTTCEDGLYCTAADQCVGGACNAGAARDCLASGDQCNDGVCDEGADQCVAQPRADGTACTDGLYCTQTDECQGGICKGSNDPCADNGNFCDGVEYCQEDVSNYLCSSTGDPCVLPLTCDELSDTCTTSQVTLIISDAYGYSGTIGIELENSSSYVSEVHLNVCDVDQRAWLHIGTSSCSTTARSSDFTCVVSDLGGGCVRVALTSTVSGVIDPGSGAIAVLNYTIDATAPLTDYADVRPQNYSVLDDTIPTPVSLSVTPDSGTVRAVECTTAGDCNDGNGCTDDACVASVCQYTNNTNPCDDGQYCNGTDTCSGGSCSVHSGDPCAGGAECNNTCQEATQTCYTAAGTACTDEGNVCTDDECNGTGSCVHPNNTDPCNDGIACTEGDVCSGGVCSGTPNDSLCDDTNGCTDDTCTVGVGCDYANNTNPCDDGQYCNGTDTCSGGSCSVHSGDPCAGGAECNNTCQEATQTCYTAAGTACTDDGNVCTDDECNGTGSCIHPNNTDPCNDGIACTEGDVCSGGVCSGTPNDSLCDDTNGCTDDTCTVGVGCDYVNNSNPCDDGLYCTQTDQCRDGVCVGSDDPCVDDGIFCNGVEYCQEDVGSYRCVSTEDPCVPLECDDLNDECSDSEVSLIIVDAYGYSGTIDIALDNGFDSVSEVLVDVCDVDQRAWLHIGTGSCSTTARSSDFSCAISDQGNGCVRVALTSSVSGVIDPGSGAVAVLNYTIDANAPLTDYADLNPQNSTVLDDSPTPVSLSVTPIPGRVRAVP